MTIIIDFFLSLLGLYIGFGFFYGIYFLWRGAVQLDPLLLESKKSVRFLLFPGAVVCWPILLIKSFKKEHS